MIRRWLLLVCFVLLALACLASPALAAYGPLWSRPADGAARLVNGSDGATVVWAAAEGGGTSALLAMRYSRAGDPLAASPQTLVSGIADLGGWGCDGEALTRTFRFADFVQAFQFMAAAALRAEAMNHHPEWSNVYNQVAIDLVTHDAGGITAEDLRLAGQFEEIARKLL